MSRKLAPLLLLALWPAIGLAQGVSLANVTTPTISTYTFGVGSCGSTISVKWTYVAGYNVTSALSLWPTAGSCGDAPDAGENPFTPVPLATVVHDQTGTFTVTLADLPMFSSADGGISCGTPGVQVTGYICGEIDYTHSLSTTPAHLHATALAVTYDSKPPAVPGQPSCSQEDSATSCTFSIDSDTTSAKLIARLNGSDVTSVAATVDSTNLVAKGRLTGLTNGTTYDIVAIAFDAAGNQSTDSPLGSASPVQTEGFFGVLQGDGSTERGCSVGDPSLFPLAALAALWTLGRRGAR